MKFRYLAFLILTAFFLMGQHRQVQLLSPYEQTDDPATTIREHMGVDSIEVHLDENEFEVGGCLGLDNPWGCCTGVGAGATCDDDSAWELYDGSNVRLVRFGEDGLFTLAGNDIVRGSGAATWGPAFWATTLAGTTVCTNQGLTCVNAWNLGVGATNCASTANPRVVYCQ